MVSSFPYASVNSTCAQPPPPSPPGLLRGICLPWQSQGWGIKLQILRCPGAGHLPTPGQTPNSWHARGFLLDYNYTEDVTVKTSRLAYLSRTGKIEEVCKGIFLILCMHFFIAYQARITWRNRELSTWINVFWLLNQISVDIIWKISFHIYKTIHNI